MQTYRHCFMQMKHITRANAYVGFFTAGYIALRRVTWFLSLDLDTINVG